MLRNGFVTQLVQQDGLKGHLEPFPTLPSMWNQISSLSHWGFLFLLRCLSLLSWTSLLTHSPLCSPASSVIHTDAVTVVTTLNLQGLPSQRSMDLFLGHRTHTIPFLLVKYFKLLKQIQ